MSDLESQRSFGTRATGEAPALGQFLIGEDALVIDPGRKRAFKDADPAAAAEVGAPAGELDPERSQDLREGSAAPRFNPRAERNQFYGDGFAHGTILPQERLHSAGKVKFFGL